MSDSKPWPFEEVREGVVSRVYLVTRSEITDDFHVPERAQFVERKLRHRQRKGMCAIWQSQWVPVCVDADGKYAIAVLLAPKEKP